MFKRRGMFFKLFTIYIFILFITFFFIGLVVNVLLQNEIINRYHYTFEHQREKLIYFFDQAKEENWDDNIMSSAMDLNMNQEDRMIFLFDSAGNIKFNAEKEFDKFSIDMNVVNAALNGNKFAGRLDKNNHVIYIMASPVKIATEENPDHTMVMIFEGFGSEAKDYRFIINMTMYTAISIAAVIIFFVSRKITSPLREMNHSALQFAKGDFSHRVRVKTKDEIGQLGETFNYMAKELGGIDQMRKDFVANVSHDLRSPLTSIKGFLGAFMDGTIPKEQYRKYFAIMKNETERLMKLVNDLLDMARLEAGQMELNCVPYNLSEQVRLVIAKMEPVFSGHQIEIEVLGEEEDVYVLADPHRIDQVLINLLQNAVHFSKKQSRVKVIIERKDNQANISIRDHGLGISENDMKYIWERFYKKEKARSNKGGTGIGLSIVKHIIDLHQASIYVESTVNEGTSFTFTLPLAEAADQENVD